MITQKEAQKRWKEAQSLGRTYLPYTDQEGDDTVQCAVNAAAKDGWEIVLSANNVDEITVLQNRDGELMGIAGDAGGYEARATDLGHAD